MKSFMGFVLVVALAVAGGAWYYKSRPAERPSFRTLELNRGDLLIAVSATGTVQPVEEIDVGAQVVGRVQEFGPDPKQPMQVIDFGSHVRKGDVLAKLDEQPAKAEVDKARANLKLAKADAQASAAKLAQTTADFKRADSLRDTNSESDYDRALANHSMAKADMAVSEARVEQAEIMLKQAEINLSYATITSPIDGIVIDRRVNVGQTVVAGLNAPSLFLLARDLGRLQVWAAVNEADIADVQLGQRVTFKVDAYREQTFEGTVKQIRLNAGMSNNVVTYGVVVDIDNRDGALLPYMTANLQFEVARRSDVVLAPNQALRFAPAWNQVTPAARGEFPTPKSRADEATPVETKEPTIWVLADDGLVRPLSVKLGLTDGMVTEILESELSAGDSVVVGRAKKNKQDFVSSFMSRVLRRGNE